MMEILDARWTPTVNMYKIRCGLGHEFEHRADRWRVECPVCGLRDHMHRLRSRYIGDYDEQRIQEEIEVLQRNLLKRKVSNQ